MHARASCSSEGDGGTPAVLVARLAPVRACREWMVRGGGTRSVNPSLKYLMNLKLMRAQAVPRA
eukprot:12239689-Alexandrium_andersonii.AAC.1